MQGARAVIAAAAEPSPAGERTARVLAGYRRTAGDRGRGQARPFGAADLAAVLATCHRPRRRDRGVESDQLRVRVRTSKANADGRREDLRLLAGPFARAVEDLRAATEPAAAAERVVPLVPHQVNRRLQVLAAALGLEGVSSHSRRRGLASELVRCGASTTAVQAAGGWRSAAMVARYALAVAVEDGAVARLFGGE